MNQIFSKSKILHESSKLEHFQWGIKIYGVQTYGDKNFGPLKSLGFQQLSYLQYFGLRVKINQITLKGGMVRSVDTFAVL